MKIKIGLYLTWWGPYQIFALFQKIGFSDRTTSDWANKSPQWFTDFCQWIYDKRQRKIKIKIHEYDTWSMDSTLALIIVPMLEQLKASKHGTPMSMFEEEDGIDEWGNPGEEAHKEAIERWNAVIDHMIWSFKQLTIDDGHKDFRIVEGELDLTDHPEDKGKDCTPLRWKVEPETNWNAYFAYEEKIEEGLELFGKHYRSLWD